MPSNNFEARFPSYAKRNQPPQRGRPVKAPPSQSKSRRFLSVLETGLPLLKQYADFEPHAIPATLGRKPLLRQKPVVPSWIVQRYDFSAGNGDWGDQEACSNYIFLTEEAKIGLAWTIEGGALVAGSMHALSLRGIQRVCPRSIDIPDPQAVQTKIASILGAVGVAMPQVV